MEFARRLAAELRARERAEAELGQLRTPLVFLFFLVGCILSLCSSFTSPCRSSRTHSGWVRLFVCFFAALLLIFIDLP